MYLIHALVASLIGILSGLGIGSGGLLVIYLTLALGADQLTAQGINLWFFLFSSAASLAVQWGKRRLYFRVILVMTLSGLVGALGGSLLASMLPRAILRRLFGAMLTVCGSAVLLRRKKKQTFPEKNNYEEKN